MMTKNLFVYSVKYGESVLPENIVFADNASKKDVEISFAVYLVHIENRYILIDAGCDTMPNFNMKNFHSPVVALEEIGVSAEQITDVIITHSHHDHIEAVYHFKNATVHISKNAYEKGKKHIPCHMKLNIFENEYQLTSDVKVIEWCGHSKGSAIILLKTGDKTHVFAGDECYTNANIQNKLCTGSYYDKEKATEFVQKFSNEKYIVHTCHDIILNTERII